MPKRPLAFFKNEKLMLAVDKAMNAFCTAAKEIDEGFDPKRPDYRFDELFEHFRHGEPANYNKLGLDSWDELSRAIYAAFEDDIDFKNIVVNALQERPEPVRPDQKVVIRQIAGNLFWQIVRFSNKLATVIHEKGNCWSWVEEKLKSLSARFAHYCGIFDDGERLQRVGIAWEIDRKRLELPESPQSYGRDLIFERRVDEAKKHRPDLAWKPLDSWQKDEVDELAPLQPEVHEFIAELGDSEKAYDLHQVAKSAVQKRLRFMEINDPILLDNAVTAFVDGKIWQAIKNWRGYAVGANGVFRSCAPPFLISDFSFGKQSRLSNSANRRGKMTACNRRGKMTA